MLLGLWRQEIPPWLARGPALILFAEILLAATYSLGESSVLDVVARSVIQSVGALMMGGIVGVSVVLLRGPVLKI